MTTLERLMARLDGVPLPKIEALLEDAEGMILAHTNRRELPRALETAVVQLAVVLYNREGTEGESSHSEGGVSRTMDMLPEDIRAQLRPWRLAKVVNLHASS